MNRLNFTLLFIVAFLTSHATQWTVSNRTDLPVNPGQFTTIQAAINAASAGDTILVAGSAISYASPTISKKVILLSPGYSPDKENPLIATINGNINIAPGNTSGTVIEGFNISGDISLNSGTTFSNISIRKNLLNAVLIYDSTINLLVAENIFTINNGGASFWMNTGKSQTNFTISNNIFVCNNSDIFRYSVQVYCGDGSNAPTYYNPIYFIHNLWINGSQSTPLVYNNFNEFAYHHFNSCNGTNISTITNAVINNNIFYNVNGGADTSSGSFYNYTYNNNITYSGGTLPLLPSPTCIGSGNLNNVDPQFVSIFNTANTVSFNLDNLRLRSTSPAKNAGTDGTDIGPTGGLYPIYRSTNRYLTGEPPVPEVKSMDFTGNSSVQPGGSLTLQIKATKIN